MHIHGTGMNFNSTVALSAAAQQKAAEAARRAEVRRRLLKAGASALTPEEAALVGRWLEGTPHPEREP